MDRIQKVIEALKKNNMNGYYAKNIKEAIEIVEEILPEDSIIGLGGSMTIQKTELMDYVRSGRYELLDRYEEGLSQADIEVLYRKGFFADAIFTSTNAITENGELYNIDGIGNRVAAMIFGPKKVIVFAGKNKIVKDLDEARDRMKKIAAPLNAKRLNRKTPCVITGVCQDCNSEDRICSNEVVMMKQMRKDRVEVIIIDEELGF